MSESAFEPVGDVGDTAPDADAPDEGAEDAEAQELLDGMQEGADEDDSPEKLREQVAHWKRMSRQHERTATKNSAAAAKLAEIENANKSDLEKANEALAAAQRERDSLVTERQRMLAAAAHDLPPDLIEYLGDGTAEEISERAEQLAGIINITAKKLAAEMAPQPTNGARPTSGRRPVDALRPGAAPADNRVLTPDQAFRQLLTGDSD